MNHLCQIIREDTYEESIRLISKNYTRANELDSAIDWALSRIERKLSRFIHIRDDYYFWVTDELPVDDIPRVRIVFKYDRENSIVYLINIEDFSRNNE